MENKIELFGTSGSGLIERLIEAYGIPFEFKKGQEIFNEGKISKGIFCIEEGKVKVFHTCSNSQKIITGLAGPGDLLGGLCFETDRKLLNTATCLENTKVWFIPRYQFQEFSSQNPEVIKLLYKYVIYESEKFQTLIHYLKGKSVRERVANSLLMLESKFGLAENSDSINVEISRLDIAYLAGTTIESAIRYVNELKVEGIVRLDKKKIIIINKDKLIREAGN